MLYFKKVIISDLIMPKDKDPTSDSNNPEGQTALNEEAMGTSVDSTGLPATGTEVDSTSEQTRSRLEASMEAGEKMRPLVNAIHALHAKREPINTFQTVLDLLRNDKISKKDKHSAIKTLMLMITENFGKTEYTETGKPTWTSNEYLENFYKILQEYIKYFEGIVEKDCHHEMLKRIAEECLKPFDVTQERESEPVWVAEHLSARIDFAEEINRTVPIEDLAQRKQKGVAMISRILGENTSIAYYNPTSRNDSDNNAIVGTLARKHDIALPSKKEVWEKKIQEEIGNIDKKLKELEQRLESGKVVYELGKIERSIGSTEQFLKQASQEIEGFILPAGATSVEAIIGDFRKRLEKISTSNTLLETEISLQSLESAFKGNGEIIDNCVRNFLGKVHTTRDNPEVDVIIPKITARLETLRIEEEQRIKDLAGEIVTDPTKAEEKGDKLATRGKVLKRINSTIASFNSKLGGKQAKQPLSPLS